MRINLVLSIPLIAGGLALSPALAAHPDHRDNDETAERPSDGEHENCAHETGSRGASHDGHTDHDHNKDETADGHRHDCEGDPDS